MMRFVAMGRVVPALFLALFLAAGLPQDAQARGPESVAALARELSDAVVNISTTRRVPGGQGVPFPEAPDGSPLNEYFDDLNPNQGQGRERMREAESLGSGFLISADGLIVTNNHVIEGADEILVYLTDQTRYQAEVVGSDEKADLAVLRITADHPLNFVEFGDSDAAEVGDWVMAIGNPFGLGGSVTLGIVSARDRDINSGPYDDFIQTDAAINQGNSGGPLFDMDGKVVGINTAIIARGGGGLGIGFAVPTNLAQPIVRQLIDYGETRRGWLGVGIQAVGQDIATSLGRKSPDGALVVQVMDDGPSKGVLREGDLILAFDGKPISRMQDLPRIVAGTEVGKDVVVHVLRGGVEEDFWVTVGRLETSPQEVASAEDQLPEEKMPAVTESPDPGEYAGLKLEALGQENRKAFDIADAVNGVLIADVVPGSNADEKGLMPGFVIEEVNQKPVADVADVAGLIGAAREAGRPMVLLKVADPSGARRFYAVQLD